MTLTFLTQTIQSRYVRVANEILMHFRSQKKTLGDIYIDDPIDTDKDGNALTLMDIMGDGKDIVEQVDLSIRSGQLYGFLENTLDDREFEIIKHRYGLYGCNALTQREVAQKRMFQELKKRRCHPCGKCTKKIHTNLIKAKTSV